VDNVDTEERKEWIPRNYTRISGNCVSNNEGQKEDIGNEDK